MAINCAYLPLKVGICNSEHNNSKSTNSSLLVRTEVAMKGLVKKTC